MCGTLSCLLKSKLTFFFLVLLFLPIGQLPPLYLAGPIVQTQCYGDYTRSKDDNNDDEDGGADSSVQSCSNTEDRELGEFKGKRITLAQPTKPTSWSHPPQPTEIFILSMFG